MHESIREANLSHYEVVAPAQLVILKFHFMYPWVWTTLIFLLGLFLLYQYFICY